MQILKDFLQYLDFQILDSEIFFITVPLCAFLLLQFFRSFITLKMSHDEIQGRKKVIFINTISTTLLFLLFIFLIWISDTNMCSWEACWWIMVGYIGLILIVTIPAFAINAYMEYRIIYKKDFQKHFSFFLRWISIIIALLLIFFVCDFWYNSYQYEKSMKVMESLKSQYLWKNPEFFWDETELVKISITWNYDKKITIYKDDISLLNSCKINETTKIDGDNIENCFSSFIEWNIDYDLIEWNTDYNLGEWNINPELVNVFPQAQHLKYYLELITDQYYIIKIGKNSSAIYWIDKIWWGYWYSIIDFLYTINDRETKEVIDSFQLPNNANYLALFDPQNDWVTDLVYTYTEYENDWKTIILATRPLLRK